MFDEQDAVQEYLDDCKSHPNELKERNIKALQDLNNSGTVNVRLNTKYKQKINILYSDLDNFSDDCLVNAANELLLGGGGIDGFVHALGGEKLLEEVKQIPLNSYGCRLLEGEAVFTNGYNDKYPTFIHTVAPYYDDYGNLKPDVMGKCFDNIFRIVQERGIKSITIPAIGTGFYGFYMYEYTLICFQKIIQYLDLCPHLEKVTIVTNYKLQYNFYYLIMASICEI